MSEPHQDPFIDPATGLPWTKSQRVKRALARRMPRTARAFHWLRAKARHYASRAWHRFSSIPRTGRWLGFVGGEIRRRRRQRGLTVAVDVTPLWDSLTGVGWYLYRLLEQLADHPEVTVRLYGPNLLTGEDVPEPVVPLPEGSSIEHVAFDVPHRLVFSKGWFMGLLRGLEPLLIALDRNRMVLNMSQTWHQVRPGEARYDCGGCHAHAELPTDFYQTAASDPGYTIQDLAQATPVISHDVNGDPVQVVLPGRAIDVEYHRDVKPIFERSCVPCHNLANPSAELVLDDTAIVDRHENSYNRLARDEDADYGYPPVISNGTWRQTNASRYIRKFQSRRSLLIWKIFGERLDGWTNADHPTESIPGDAGSLPAGSQPNQADLDYSGDPMPPPGAVHPVSGDPIVPLTQDERMLIATWIDLGCPVNVTEAAGQQRSEFGWFLDDLRPTLTVSSPRAGTRFQPLTTLNLGAFDYYSGLDTGSMSVQADFAVNGRPAGAELFDLFQSTGDHIWSLTLDTPISTLPEGNLTVKAYDAAGNLTRIDRRFAVYGHVLQLFRLDLWHHDAMYNPLFDLNQDSVIDLIDMVDFMLENLPPG